MVHFSGLESVIESIYLEDRLGNKSGDCGVFVNPENTKYLVGKICIINSTQYPEEYVKELVDNGNKVVSRILLPHTDIIFQPYIIRVSPGIMYNGKNVQEKLELEDVLQNYCLFDSILYFPKLDPSLYPVIDKEGNLTALGWALHQVGVLVRPGLSFPNLDIIKLKKIGWK